MAPDLNSLPPSRSIPSPSSISMSRTASVSEASALRTQTPSPSSRTASTSLQAAATVNAGLQHETTRRSSGSLPSRNRQTSHPGRRRSTVLMNLQLNDPSLPPPGEMVNEGPISNLRTSRPHSLTGSPTIPFRDPHHNRAPSLGEIHQEIEQEQEAQVNRLLHMIRTQQQQLQALQAASGQPQTNPLAIDDSTPTSERAMSFTQATAPLPQSSTSTPRSPSIALHPRSSFDLVRTDIAHRRSRTPSRNASPRMRATSMSGEGDSVNFGGRDESAFYQAETQMMIRENQMLRQRIRELERQVSEQHSNSNITREPATPSHLLRSTSISEGPTTGAAVDNKDE
ncbi:hypothetical protein HYALB_00005490 [Hymenoscyphus albidus]|uniref:Uncharacterized protein n=1 Tax=Hymenoscyphus albidus TaxID=595503 RepID=A0A9N9QDT8_9HELO|nr:hypothetical protein HYALB_00005490 [Hymenoscyphus albidus]